MIDFLNQLALSILMYAIVTRGGLAVAKGLSRLVQALR